jgi:hypothetical protein
VHNVDTLLFVKRSVGMAARLRQFSSSLRVLSRGHSAKEADKLEI